MGQPPPELDQVDRSGLVLVELPEDIPEVLGLALNCDHNRASSASDMHGVKCTALLNATVNTPFHSSC